LEIINQLDQLPQSPGFLAVTLGNFDGLHSGHRLLIRQLRADAEQHQGKGLVFTFEPHPATIVAPQRIPQRLTTKEEQISLLEAAGVDYLLYHPFTPQLAQLSAWEFISKLLHEQLQARSVIVGPNFHFGHQRQGDVALLRKWGAELGFTTRIVEPARENNQIISSSRIRQLLAMGEVSQAARLLGYAYYLQGAVISGAARGREMGYPTLNMTLPAKLIPASGVYLTQAQLNGKNHFGVSNLGLRPTFHEHTLTLETHFLDYQEEVRPTALKLHFLQRIRDERKFASITELIAQIEKDTRTAYEYINQTSHP